MPIKQSKDNTNTTSTSIPEDSLIQKYENEFFSIMYPQNWTTEWKDYDAEDERLLFVLDSLSVKGGSVELLSPDRNTSVKITKSVYAWIIPHGTPGQ